MARKTAREGTGPALPRTTEARLLFLVLSALLMSGCGRERIIGINQRIHHDDFEYTVTSWSVTDTIGHGASQVRARGEFYVVMFQVENRARRVDHEWDNGIAFIVDEDGSTYENSVGAQNALRRVEPVTIAERHRTPAGSTERTAFVFDLPRDVRKPCLMVRGEFLMGDLFDGKAFANTRVKLF